jgi:hypothetical protein
VTVFSVPMIRSNYWLSAILIDPVKTAGITRNSAIETREIKHRITSAMETDAFATCFSEYPYYVRCRDTF